MKRRRIATPKDEALPESRVLARLHVGDVLEELARLACGAHSENVRVSAIKEILDRAHGRPVASAEAAGGVQPLLVDDGYSD
jgi:hypothetical protein